jgi:DnaJ-class molecular chaperone
MAEIEELVQEGPDRWTDDEDWPKCPTCHGRGTINPLTAPPGFFCVSTEECPTCEGSGDCP